MSRKRSGNFKVEDEWQPGVGHGIAFLGGDIDAITLIVF